jgi:amino acid exporter
MAPSSADSSQPPAAHSFSLCFEARTLAGATRSPLGYAIRGLIIQMTNPKAALAWIAIMSLGLQAGAPTWVPVSLVAGTSILSVIIHCVYAVAFSTPGLKLLTSRS